MQEANDSESISPEQYETYSVAWRELIHSANDDELAQAFQTPASERSNFLTFSIDQIRALVSAVGAALIKARFLLMPDATGQARFSVTLFAVDAKGDPLSAYYIPTQLAATTAQAVESSDEPSTQITPAEALHWLTDWVEADALATAMFTTSHGPLHGYNFEVSTFKDPLAEAHPYDEKNLFLNCGLRTETEITLITLVVYISQIGSRVQGSLAGIPGDGPFYDTGLPCPPAT